MPAWKVVSADQVTFVDLPSDVAGLLVTAHLIGPAEGAVHLEVALARLAPGGTVHAHLHPFEESFYVLEGEGLFRVADATYRVRAGSHGFAPIRTPHGWTNESDEPLLWIRTRSPQSRAIGETSGTYRASDVWASSVAVPSDGPARSRRFVGQYGEDQMPAPGPIQMKGFRSAAARNVAVWMLVDEVVGAVHHTKFAVRFDPTDGGLTLGGQHLHPFEETYYITSGRAVAHLEDESIEVGPGDVVFAGVNAFHGFSNPGTEPVRWIEMQAPNPPISDAFLFKADWQES